MLAPAFLYDLSCRSISGVVVLAAYLAHYEFAHAATVREIQAAWQKHSAAIESIRYQFHQSKTEELNKTGSNDPFELPNQFTVKDNFSLKGSITFLRAGEKAKVTRQAEQWDDEQQKPIELRQEFSFDGTQNMSDWGAGGGQIEDSSVPADSISRSAELIPICWAHWPEEQRNKFNDVSGEDLKLSDYTLSCGTTPCLEITAHSQKVPDSLKRVYVDTVMGYRVVKVNHFFKGDLRKEVSIEYNEDRTFGWSVAGFKSTYYDADGKPELMYESKVDACAFNQQVSDRDFLIDFPIGTIINKNGATFRQESGRELRKVQEKGTRRGPRS